MGIKRHKQDTRTFEELSYSGQAKSISAQITRLQASVIAHLRRAQEENRNIDKIRLVCISQVARLVARLTKNT